MSNVTLDWSSAEVRDGKLEVKLQGEFPPEWKESFKRTVALLPGGEWGEVKLKKGQVRVHDVVEGGEDRLHHFLESVVTQANAADEEPKADDDADGDQDEAGLDGRDLEMTERFRSFANDDGD